MLLTISPQISLPEYLVILRRRLGLSQLNAASRAGLKNRHLYRLEHGQIACQIDDIITLANLYGVLPATFLAIDATAPDPHA